MFAFSKDKLRWINPPKEYKINENVIEITTMPNTDLWQRTYYGFRRANAHMLVMPVSERYFSFRVKARHDGNTRYDQCGIVIFQDEENWFKCALEDMGTEFRDLGSVVTNNGYSDFGCTAVSPSVDTMYYRLSRRESDYRLERSFDGVEYRQMRMFHLAAGSGEINMGLFACSPSDASCRAVFSEMEITECTWGATE